MPAKRPPTASLLSTPKSKKTKGGQSSLDTFFAGSASSSKSPGRAGKKTAKGSASPSKPSKEPVAGLVAQEVIDVDLLYEDEKPTFGSDSLGAEVPAAEVVYRSPTPATSPKKAKYVFMGADPNSTKAHTYPLLGVDPLIFGIDESPWPPNTAATYSFLSHTLTALSETRSRIIILNTLTNCLRVISRHHTPSLLPSLYLMSNALSPSYLPIELGLGPSLISKAIQASSGLTAAALRQLYNSTGDVGDVAFQAKSNLRTLIPHPPLLITGVYDALLKIANAKGQGAGKIKQGIVEKLLVAAKGEETRFLVRTLSLNLRVGAVRTSILTALARAMALTPPATIASSPLEDSIYAVHQDILAAAKGPNANDTAKEVVNQKLANAESLVKQVFVQHPNYDDIIAALLDAGLDCLSEKVPLAVGIPLHPTLGSPTRSLDEVYERLGDLPFAAEYKYDGQRAQIHCEKSAGEVVVRIFSRHLEDMTTKYPDVVSVMHEMFSHDPKLQSCILDSEIVAIDPANGELKSFQELSNRARKDVHIVDVKVCVGVFVFDLMYLDGEILLEQAFRRRRTLLRERLPLFSPQPGLARFSHVESCESEDGREVVEEFWMKAVESRCEGLMIKLLDSGDAPEEAHLKEKEKEKNRKKPLPATYRPDKRTSAWLKLKKDYVTGLGDSLDLVPIGAWHGNGRKANWWSPVLLALHDNNSGKFVAVCKCMSGFTDVFYQAMRETYAESSETCSRENQWNVETGGLIPSVYFKPNEVWEIRGADVTLSPVSVAAFGLVSDSRGLSLRFPRFIKVRDDKKLEQASDPAFLAKMWRDQQGKSKRGADDGDLVDVDFEEEIIEEEDGDE